MPAYAVVKRDGNSKGSCSHLKTSYKYSIKKLNTGNWQGLMPLSLYVEDLMAEYSYLVMPEYRETYFNFSKSRILNNSLPVSFYWTKAWNKMSSSNRNLACILPFQSYCDMSCSFSKETTKKKRDVSHLSLPNTSTTCGSLIAFPVSYV